jgi:hypothetical protein
VHFDQLPKLEIFGGGALSIAKEEARRFSNYLHLYRNFDW